jgi:exopolysaccharide biosynthesis polyprenyl glycosylphosphotransferase
MRIAKATHLRRLLQTQDVLVSTLAFLVTFNAFWLTGAISYRETLSHLQLAPIVAMFSLLASVVWPPKLHGQHLREIVVFALRHAGAVLSGILLITYLARFDFHRDALIAFVALLCTAMLVNRGILRWWYFHGRREHPANFLKVLVIGSGPRARRLMQAYLAQSDWGVSIVGILDPQAQGVGGQVDGVPVLGHVDEIRTVLATRVVDEVVVCLPRSLINDIGEVVAACEEQAVCMKFMADVYDLGTGTISLETIGALPVLSIEPIAHDEGRLVVKRILDLLMTIPALILLTPLFLVVALAVRLDSKGPAFFVQSRIGLNMRPFNMIKFRSMYQDAEERLKDVEHLNEADGPIFKIANDPRVTRVGRFLRKTSIDELPQLINVLLGQMSLVGPRPMSLRDVQRFSRSIQRRRFSVRPGLACLREVSGRSRLSFERWLQLDLKYIDEWSLLLDLKILLLLIPSVLKGDGAS